MIYIINFSDNSFNQVLYYISHISEKSAGILEISSRTHKDTDEDADENKLKVFYKHYKSDETEISYEGMPIKITLVKFTKPVVVGHLIVNNKELIIDCSPDVIKPFLQKSKTYYQDIVLNKAKKNDLINIYMWEEYEWSVLKTQPTRALDTLYFDTEFLDNIVGKVRHFLSNDTKKMYRRIGIPYKMNILLEGLAGTGKTSLITGIASEFEKNIAIINFDAKTTDNMFINAMALIPKDTILILEDIDVLFKERKEHDTHKNALTFSGLINALDGISAPQNSIIFMTSNYKCNLDKALIRPGRVDLSVNFTYANKEQVSRMYKSFFPETLGYFNEFYGEIKHLKFTTALLQQFMFEFIELGAKTMVENIDKFKKYVVDYKIDSDHIIYS